MHDSSYARDAFLKFASMSPEQRTAEFDQAEATLRDAAPHAKDALAKSSELMLALNDLITKDPEIAMLIMDSIAQVFSVLTTLMENGSLGGEESDGDL